MCAAGRVAVAAELRFRLSEIIAGRTRTPGTASARSSRILRPVGTACLDGEHLPQEQHRSFPALSDARNLGQNHEVVVPMPSSTPDSLENLL